MREEVRKFKNLRKIKLCYVLHVCSCLPLSKWCISHRKGGKPDGSAILDTKWVVPEIFPAMAIHCRNCFGVFFENSIPIRKFVQQLFR